MSYTVLTMRFTKALIPKLINIAIAHNFPDILQFLHWLQFWLVQMPKWFHDFVFSLRTAYGRQYLYHGANQTTNLPFHSLT